MKMSPGHLSSIPVLLVGLLLFSEIPAYAVKPVPPLPEFSTFDETHSFAPGSMQALQSLLIEHDRMTGEQIRVGIFQGLEGENAQAYTRKVHDSWRSGQGSSVLLAIFAKEHLARIEVGFGLENLLTEERTSAILAEAVFPELEKGHLRAAVGNGTLEVLKAIQSPLIPSGKATEILRSGGFKDPAPAASLDQEAPGRGWITLGWLVLGSILATSVFAMLTSAEAHFTSRGWIHPKPWPLLGKKILKRMGLGRSPVSPGASRTGGTRGHW